jgi:hypothetical protein
MVGEGIRRVGLPAHQTAREVARVAADEVLPDELVAPAGERERVPSTSEEREGDEARDRHERAHSTEIALPREEQDDRRRVERGRDRSLRHRRETEERERRGRMTRSTFTVDAKREVERDGEQQEHEEIRSRELGAGRERGKRREEETRGDAGRDTERLHAEACRPRHEPGRRECRRQPDGRSPRSRRSPPARLRPSGTASACRESARR